MECGLIVQTAEEDSGKDIETLMRGPNMMYVDIKRAVKVRCVIIL